MTTIAVIFEIKWVSSKEYNRVYKKFVTELSKGRPDSQIVLDKSICFLSTPENAKSISDRIINCSSMNPDTDGFLIIDFINKQVMIWGSYSNSIEDKMGRFGSLKFERVT